MGFIEYLRAAIDDRYAMLFEGVSEVTYLDFPDHSNAGDSFLALGMLEYLQANRIHVPHVYAYYTGVPRDLSRSGTLYFNGGGNLGGLYHTPEANRYEVLRRLPESSLFIQGPQSIVFASDDSETRFRSEFSRSNVRLAVRDDRSHAAADGSVPHLHLVPDSAHYVQGLPTVRPSAQVVYLLRQDKESGLDPYSARSAASTDWKDPLVLSASTRVRRIASKATGADLGVRTAQRARSVARRRVNRAAHIVGAGETVVTDRLHAMILALHLGRRVVAIDNNNGKLTAYASAWLTHSEIPLDFADDLGSAMALVGRRRTGRA